MTMTFFDAERTKKCLFRRGVKYPKRVQSFSKTAIPGNADGQMLAPYVVHKADHLWSSWIQRGPENTRYNHTSSGWLYSRTFADWFESVFIDHVRRLEGPKVLIGGNLSRHFKSKVLELAEEHNVRFICLPANSAHILQPLDVAFFGPMKRGWRSSLNDWKSGSKNTSRSLSKDCFPRLLK